MTLGCISSERAFLHNKTNSAPHNSITLWACDCTQWVFHSLFIAALCSALLNLFISLLYIHPTRCTGYAYPPCQSLWIKASRKCNAMACAVLVTTNYLAPVHNSVYNNPFDNPLPCVKPDDLTCSTDRSEYPKTAETNNTFSFSHSAAFILQYILL